MSGDWPVRHPTWNGVPILLGDQVEIKDTDPDGPVWCEEVTAITFDSYTGTTTFSVGGQYWTVCMTEAQSQANSDYDDRYWIVGHKPAALSTTEDAK